MQSSCTIKVNFGGTQKLHKMSDTKNANLRYRILDSCFRNFGYRYFIEDLIESCEKLLLEINPESNGISRRQILSDISFMESTEGWSIELQRIRDGKRVFYRYVDPSYSINNMPLNKTEIEQLTNAIEILSQFKGMPQFEWIHELLPKLKQGISSQTSHVNIIEFDNNQYLTGIEHLGPLYNAIFNKTVLEVAYQPFSSLVPDNIIIHPYYLKQYNNRWFLFGFNPDNERYDWTLAIDRIKEIKVIRGKYQNSRISDWTEHFEDIIGVTRPEGALPETVVLHFLEQTGKYIETKPIHGSQKSKWKDGIFEVSLTIIINYEFERLLLSYADTVKIIEPIFLANKLKDRLFSALSFYK